MATDKKLITVKEAATILQRSPSAVYQALRAHPPRLQYADPLRRLIARDGLEERWARSTRPRVDYPRVDCKPPSVERTERREWERVADRANEMLDPDTWGPPPWSADRWAALAGVLDMAAEDD